MSETYRFGRNVRSFLRGALHPSSHPRGIPHTWRSEPILQIEEIQGNSLAGFSKDFQAFMFLRIVDPPSAKRGLKQVVARIATLKEVLTFKKLYKAMKARRGFNFGALQATWVNIAFSFQGLRKLTPEADQFTDVAFKEGMHARSSLLSDPADLKSDGNSLNWIIGGPDNAPDLVLTVASDSEDRLNVELERIRTQLGAGLHVIHVEMGRVPPAPFSAREHFGFRDGVSQPGIRGRVSNDPDDFLTNRENPLNINQGKPGQDLVWPGEFVFGYPGQHPKDPYAPGPVVEDGPRWVRNGSYLVFRKYRQDVRNFHRFLNDTARQLAFADPSLRDLTPEKLGAKLVGRWQSGAPLMRASVTDIPAIADDSCADNHFDFVNPTGPITRGTGKCADDRFPQSPGDSAGLICPHASHIRKANPRDDLQLSSGWAEAHRHRILRRGIPYGDPAQGESGLLFLCYQTSIERQFEFIVGNWLNNPNLLNRGEGHDPLVGQTNAMNSRKRFFTLPIRNADGTVRGMPIELPEDWVTPLGGEYFFAPSISALKYLAN